MLEHLRFQTLGKQQLALVQYHVRPVHHLLPYPHLFVASHLPVLIPPRLSCLWCHRWQWRLMLYGMVGASVGISMWGSAP